MTIVKKEYYSAEEIEQQIHNLSNIDLLRLQKIANKYTGNHELKADDLIQEAVCRILAGERKKWPVDLPILSFIAGIMKSIAYDERRKRAPVIRYDEDQLNSIKSEDAAIDEKLITEEEHKEVQEKFKVLEKYLSDDEEVLLVIMHLSEEHTPSQIMADEKWEKRQYDTIRRRMRRKINKLQEKGVI